MGWLGRTIVICILAVVFVVTWAALARAFAPHENTAQDHFDAVIVLGYPADADGNPSPIEQSRVNEAVREYERGVAPRIILSGGAAHNRFVEAQVMARIAQAQGMPAGAILEDTQAMNTIENACNSMKILRSHGWNSAEVVTSPYHASRAAMIFNRLPLKWRMHTAPLPVPDGRVTTLTTATIEILKTVHYLVWSRQTEPCEMSGQ